MTQNTETNVHQQLAQAEAELERLRKQLADVGEESSAKEADLIDWYAMFARLHQRLAPNLEVPVLDVAGASTVLEDLVNANERELAHSRESLGMLEAELELMPERTQVDTVADRWGRVGHRLAQVLEEVSSAKERDVQLEAALDHIQDNLSRMDGLARVGDLPPPAVSQ